MRLPFPERLPLDRVGLFAIGLFLIQILEGTAFYFAVGTAAFIIVSALAFNIAGGLSRTAGVYIFAYSTLCFIVGVCVKAALREPGESNLRAPHTTINVYMAGILVMGLAAILSKAMMRKVGILRYVVKDEDLYGAAIGCLAFGIFGSAIISLLGASSGKINSAFSQLNELIPLSIIMATMYAIRTSKGRRSTNTASLFAMGYFFLFFGILGFSKQGMLSPLLCWLVPVAALRFRLSKVQIVSVLLGSAVIFYYLVPYSQYGRTTVTEGESLRTALNIEADLLLHPNDTRAAYLKSQAQSGESPVHYFNQDEGFFDRLQFIGMDDALNDVTDQGHQFGLAPVQAAFLNVVPRVLWKNKPTLSFGTQYAQELGLLPVDDITTGVSFSPTGEAYHLAGWVGVLVVAPIVWLLLFVIADFLYGDVRTTPWGLLAVVLLTHIAPENGILGAIYFLTFGSVILSFCAFFSSYIAPIFAIAVLGVKQGKKRPVGMQPSIGQSTPV